MMRGIVFIIVLFATPAFSAAPSVAPVTMTPEEFGAAGDCVADDTAALISMRDAIRNAQVASPLATFTIQFGQNKCYKYTSNHWTWGIRRLRLLGNGSSFQNVGNDQHLQEKHVFMANRDPFRSGIVDQYWAARTNAYLIQSANAGDVSVITVTPGDAANFAPNQWALIYSRDQQFEGYPPNVRYFDYVRVQSVKAKTGVITLDRPLERSHSATAPEITQTIPVGRARIVPIEDQDILKGVAFGETMYAENMTFLNNPNNPTGNYDYVQNRNQVYFDGYEKVILVNTTGPTLVISQSKDVIVTNSHWYEVIPDKIVRSLAMIDCIVDDGISEGTGVALLRAPVVLSPRRLFIEGIECDSATVQPPTQPAINIASRFPTGTLEINNVRCFGSGAASGHVLGNYNSSLKLSVGRDAALSGQNQLIANITLRGSIQQRVLSCLEEGTYAGILAGGAGQEIPATVTGVAGDGASTNAVVNIKSTHALVDGDVVVCHTILASNITSEGLSLVNYAASPFHYMPSP
jgi:hypothetical protein